MGSVFKQALKNLCCSNGWSYGVFWRFDQRNSMLLTMEGAYYEEQMGPMVDSMLLKFHILSEGIISQAAFMGKHQWIFSDTQGGDWDSTGNQNIFQDEYELQNQFSSGIKTVAIISLERRGVVQLGSTKKILEGLEFLDETKKLFYDMPSCHGLAPLEIETCNSDGQGGFSREPKGWPYSSKDLTESSCFTREIQDQRMNLCSRIYLISEINCKQVARKLKLYHLVYATPKKPTGKRAKPGESTRPRPNDRQLIQDRIKELRGIIPHGGKQLSIDHLSERTIKQLLFLQGVTKHADKSKQADEPNENGMLPKHNKMSGGATWASEVGAQSISVVVEDLNPPGQMEMLCDDWGFFLEIADVVMGLRLNILKGVMELREDKIWTRFVVEAKERVERTNIFWYLLLLLQQICSSGIHSASQSSGNMDGGISLLSKLSATFAAASCQHG